jgi:hypothetical protein
VTAVVVAGLLACGPGCAEHAASKATEGALDTLAEKTGSPPGERPAETVARRAVEGALAHLTEPEQLEKIREVAGQAAQAAATQAGQAAVAAITAQLGRDLGSHAEGPLAQQVSALVEEATRSATEGALRSFAPGCAPGDAACIDRRMAALSERAAAGFVLGLRDQLGVVPLAVAFLLGVLATLVVVLAVRLVRGPRGHGREVPTRALAPGPPVEQPL